LVIKVFLNPINREIDAERGDNLLEVMREAGVRIESLCGGKGQCGKCKVILEEGEVKKISKTPDKFLSHDELEGGYYLACMVELQGDCIFTIPTESRIDDPKILLSAELLIESPEPASRKYIIESLSFVDSLLFIPRSRIKLRDYEGMQPRIDDEISTKLQIMSDQHPLSATISLTGGFPEIIDIEPGDKTGENYGLAIDIGTTTIVGLLVDLKTGDILGRGSEMNRQITYGEELVTRISYSRDPEGLLKLQKTVVETINNVVSQVITEVGVNSEKITDVCAGGNTVMNHLLAGLESTYLEMANVEVSREPIIKKAKHLGLDINPESYIYCVPNVSRFLGGDAVGDVLASNMHKSDEISLMVDL
jgi:uncharacterized 2Fe-2S/4Fe-4S cluster protein (DUF4445 family)